MTAHEQGEGAELVRRVHQAYNDRDRDALLAVMAEDIVWHVEGNSPIAGTHEGRQQVWESFFAHQWEDPVRLEDHDILDNGEHVVALMEVIVDLGDEQRRWRVAEIAHVEDGLLAERWAYSERQAELDEVRRSDGTAVT